VCGIFTQTNLLKAQKKLEEAIDIQRTASGDDEIAEANTRVREATQLVKAQEGAKGGTRICVPERTPSGRQSQNPVKAMLVNLRKIDYKIRNSKPHIISDILAIRNPVISDIIPELLNTAGINKSEPSYKDDIDEISKLWKTIVSFYSNATGSK